MAQNRLDAAIDRLEQQLKGRIEEPLRQLRQVIEERRAAGGFDEGTILVEIEDVISWDKLSASAMYLDAAQAISAIAQKLRESLP